MNNFSIQLHKQIDTRINKRSNNCVSKQINSDVWVETGSTLSTPLYIQLTAAHAQIREQVKKDAS